MKSKSKLSEKYKNHSDQNPIQVRLAGRLMTRRIMGKASFFNLQDRTGRFQNYISKNDLKHLDA